MRPSLEELRDSARDLIVPTKKREDGKRDIRGGSYHPLTWEKRDIRGPGGEVISVNRDHVLYISKRALGLIEKRLSQRGSGRRRWHVPKRHWDSKRGIWVYKFRHWKKKVGGSWTSMSAYKDGAPKGDESRQGGKAHGRTYIIRKCIWKILNAPLSGEMEHELTSFTLDSILEMEGGSYERGPVGKLTIRMPDFSLAIREVLLRQEKVDDEVFLKGIIPSYCTEDPNKRNEGIMGILPERGPGSGPARRLVGDLIGSSAIESWDGDIEELQIVIDRVWRGVLCRLVELCLEREVQILARGEDDVVWDRREVHQRVLQEEGLGPCPNSECEEGFLIPDEPTGEIWCVVCGYVLESSLLWRNNF